MKRLTRTQKAAQSRETVLSAAGKLFRQKGFHGASLEEIADEAGFSKGVIYSQFGSKDDLFLALVEQRMEWRISKAHELIRNAPEGAGLRELWEQARSVRRSDVAWALLILEFRIHAARNPEVNRCYEALHERTLRGGAKMIEALASRAGIRLHFPPEDLSRLIACLDSGGVLEEMVEGPGSAFELSRHAVWLLLMESARGDPDQKEDPL